MRIMLDMDEVIVSTVGTWVDKYNKKFGKNLIFGEITDWNIGQFVEDSSVSDLYSIIDEDGFFLDLLPVNSAVLSISKLIKQGHDVIIVTATPLNSKSAFLDKIKWIERHMPFFDVTNLISASRKDVINADIIFDDAVHNLRNRSCVTVAMERPWNINHSDEYTHSVKNWKHFLDIVDHIQSMKES